MRFLISRDKIKTRNKAYESIHTDAKNVFKMVGRKHNYINQRDFSVDYEDIMQELAESYLLFLDKKIQQDNVDLVLIMKPEMIMRVCQNTVVSILRKIDAQKRGSGRLKDKEDVVHLGDVPEDILSTTITDGVIVHEFLQMLTQEDGSSFGLDEHEWSLFTDYYILGYTQQEVIDKCKTNNNIHYTQQNLSSKLQRLGNIVLPQLKAQIQDLIIMEND